MTTASGALNGFPLNGNFDASIVGIAAPLMHVTVSPPSGPPSMVIGLCMTAEIADDILGSEGLQATVGIIWEMPVAELGVFGLEADGTQVFVDAEHLEIKHAIDVAGIFQPVVGVGYIPQSLRTEVIPELPDISIGQEHTLPVILHGDVVAITPAWFIYAEGAIPQAIQIDISDPAFKLTVFVEIEIFETGQVAQVIQQDIINQDIQKVAQTIEQIVFDTVKPSVVLQQENIDHTLFIYGSGDNECWRVVVTLGGVDISANITGVVRVEAEESTARIADFQMKPTAGAIDVTSWVNELVTIDYALFDPVTDLVTTQIRVFNGTVDEPTYDPNTRLVDFKCSDNYQQELESMTRPQLDNITPGARWSPLIFHEESDNFVYVTDRQSTFPASLDKNIGGSYEFTPWAAKVTPDYTFLKANIIDVSLDVELSNRREIINRIDLTFGYGFDRLIERNRTLAWNFPGRFCDYLGNGILGRDVGPFTIPNRDMIGEAIDGSGWCAKSIAFGKLPRTQIVNCFQAGVSAWIISDERRDFLVPHFSAQIQRRFVRAIREDFKIIISNADSILLYGQNNAERESSVQSSYDTSEWENQDECNSQIDVTLFPSTDPLVPGCDSYKDTDTLAEDGTTRAEVNFAIETEIARSRTEMLENHRQNIVSFDTPLFPIATRAHTIEIDTDTVDARGKVQKFVHTMDLTSGQAMTAWELAVSQAGGTTAVDSPIVAPTPPDTITPMLPMCQEPTLALDTHYGGIDGNNGGLGDLTRKSEPEPEFDAPIEEQFTGYIGNQEPPHVGSVTYAVRMVVPTDEVAEEDREELVAEEETPYTVAIPDELLNLFA